MPIPSLETAELFVLLTLTIGVAAGIVFMLESTSRTSTFVASCAALLCFGASAYLLMSADRSERSTETPSMSHSQMDDDHRDP